MKKYIVLAIMLQSLLLSGIPTRLDAAPKKSGSGMVKKKKKTKAAPAPGKGDFSPLNFAPFGIGQFVQGRPIMGGILGGGQAAMLFLYLDRQKQVSASNSDASATIAEIQASGEAADTETADYLARNAAYVKKTNTEATLCLVGFFGLYAVSVFDAIYDPFGGRKAEKKAAEIDNMDDDAAKWVAEESQYHLKSKPRFSMFALPTTENTKGTFGLSLQKSFR